MAVEVRRSGAGLQLDLSGEWGLGEVEADRAQLAAIDLGGVHEVKVSTRAIGSLELSGAWALHEFLLRARAAGVAVTYDGTPPAQLRLLDETLKEPEADTAPPPATAASGEQRLLDDIGRNAVRAWHDLSDALAFLGRTCLTFLGGVTSLRHLRPISIARHVYDTGITAIPIVSLIAFLISVIIAYMSAQQLRGLGVDIYVVDLVTIGVLRELGVLLTSIIVAGRTASSFAAELGSMKLNEEVDALIATGVDPFEVLVLPRLLGLTIALPLLTVIADLVGLAGGALLCRYLLDMPLTQYINRANEAISSTTFWVGIIKAPVFALLIGFAGCRHGLQVQGSARVLGREVTLAVVQAIFLVILADALFAVLFLKLDI
jgi:phospholipid/cholesterol/gamma-HCH transport system permease protein